MTCPHGGPIEECWPADGSEPKTILDLPHPTTGKVEVIGMSVLGDGSLLERAAAVALGHGDAMIAAFLSRARQAMVNMGRDGKNIDCSRHYAIYYAHKIASGIMAIPFGTGWTDNPVTWELCRNCRMPIYQLTKSAVWVHQNDRITCQSGKPYRAEVNDVQGTDE